MIPKFTAPTAEDFSFLLNTPTFVDALYKATAMQLEPEHVLFREYLSLAEEDIDVLHPVREIASAFVGKIPSMDVLNLAAGMYIGTSKDIDHAIRKDVQKKTYRFREKLSNRDSGATTQARNIGKKMHLNDMTAQAWFTEENHLYDGRNARRRNAFSKQKEKITALQAVLREAPMQLFIPVNNYKPKDIVKRQLEDSVDALFHGNPSAPLYLQSGEQLHLFV